MSSAINRHVHMQEYVCVYIYTCMCELCSQRLQKFQYSTTIFNRASHDIVTSHDIT